jgi:hypothetical protein
VNRAIFAPEARSASRSTRPRGHPPTAREVRAGRFTYSAWSSEQEIDHDDDTLGHDFRGIGLKMGKMR